MKLKRDQIKSRNMKILLWCDSPSGPGPPHCRGFVITLRHTPLCGTPVTQRPLPDNTQHSQETDIHAPRWDSNPQSQQASGRRFTPWTARPLGSAVMEIRPCDLIRLIMIIAIVFIYV